ncbi:nucleoside-diphosphate-sugar epimerase [Rhodothalassium salexigens DSM 2132]|uniref:Nucleoside-diphosphate-sugar epimerase n=1 Tax=Rhodothalassium salexigens DSM 2132 TaxID=1188247 RepID=A0A4R2PCT9_RHOSA|nr:SDR family oxidoreductase [Rhodothalassium salexigens]MBB4212119.1 nucleoside-diphosphate-sugar epimerase [Rhodothalassium salexigens DSM 2132]MBK1638335.1 NAD(P)-dependent oxidoreductase [Rhodothalassium salexigens DSM 2132]TCP32993.1 nucleoside-diphosphate-sugar epimerase [Rhodothalassium salexigens DSM 2132]
MTTHRGGGAGHLFCFGLGYSALALARAMVRAGWRVSGTVRTEEKARALAREGFSVWLFDATAPLAEPEAAFEGVTHVLTSIPPGDGPEPVLAHHRADIVRLAPHWIGYLSTTGVYGDHGGDWVDEDTPLTPSGVRGSRRVEAEQAWAALYETHSLPVHRFRLAGIYGPGRNALVSLQEGRARRIVKPGQVFSRIHVDDIAAVLRASMDRPDPGAVYNVCDDEPAPPQDLITYAAELLGVATPPDIPFESAELSPMARSFYADNKRVRNDRIKRDLGVTLAYPDYRSGLRALAAAQAA